MSAEIYPKFRVVTGILNANEEEHAEYDEIMQDVLVAKTGRYRLVSDAKTTIDKTGLMHVCIEIIDHGPEAERCVRY